LLEGLRAYPVFFDWALCMRGCRAPVGTTNFKSGISNASRALCEGLEKSPLRRTMPVAAIVQFAPVAPAQRSLGKTIPQLPDSERGAGTPDDDFPALRPMSGQHAAGTGTGRGRNKKTPPGLPGVFVG
jgi:hypothetical protein